MRKILVLCLMITLVGCNLGSSSAENDESQLPTNTPSDAQSVETTENVSLQPTRTPQPTALPIPTSNLPNNNTNTNVQTTTNDDTPVIDYGDPVFAPLAGSDRGFGVSIGDDGTISGTGVTMFDLSTYQYSQNPINPAQYAVIDQAGMLYIRQPQGDFRVEQGPYTQFPAQTRDTNNSPAIQSIWSPNGQYVAFLVDPAQEASAGLWYFQPNEFGPIQLIVDCPFEGYRGCMIVQPGADNLPRWKSLDVAFSPDSQQLLLTLDLPTEGRQGILTIGVTRNERIRDLRPEILMYEYGSWGADGRILTSGRNPQGLVNVAWINSNGTPSEQVFDASSNGLWMGWAVESANGQIYALGALGAGNTSLAIYDMNGEALTPPIGTTFPERVVWNAERTGVIIESAGRQYIATIYGQVVEITAQSGGYAVNWITN